MLSEKIKTLRKQNNLTQENLAEKLNVSRQAITKWETGAGTPDISNIEAIAKLFNLSIDELLSGENVITQRENVSRTEFDIFKACDFEFDFDTAHSLEIVENDLEKVIIEVSTDIDSPAYKLAKVKLVNGKSKDLAEISVKADKKFVLPNGKPFTKQDAKANLNVKVSLPKDLTRHIEINGSLVSLNLHGFSVSKHFEFDGKVEEVEIYDMKGRFELTSGADMVIKYDGTLEQLDINQLNALSTLILTKNAKVNVYNEGRACNVVFDGYENAEDAENKVELNGRKSELTVKCE